MLRNSTAQNAFFVVTNYTEQWDAEFAWYSPDSSQVQIVGSAATAWNMVTELSFRPIRT